MSNGIDIVYIPRMRTDDAFVDFILSKEEKEIYLKRKDKKEFLAGRYAAKEAYMKAKKVGLPLSRFSDISIIYLEGGSPVLVHENVQYEVSISHDGDYAIAIVSL